MRNHAGRQRIIAERATAEVRGQAADIGKRVDFDAQQVEFGAVGGDHLERDVAKAQKAHRVGRTQEAVDEGSLDLVEIRLDRCRRLLRGAMRRLPLRHWTLGRAVVSGAATVMGMSMRLGMRVRMRMGVTMTVIMVMVVIIAVAVLVSPVHRRSQ